MQGQRLGNSDDVGALAAMVVGDSGCECDEGFSCTRDGKIGLIL